MARSSYVYLVVETNYDGDDVQAAFTVKHECKTWMERNPRRGLSREVIRLTDGRSSSVIDRQFEEAFLAND